MEEAYPEIETVQYDKADDILESLQDHANEFDYVIADGPGSNSEISRALLMVADFAIIPCKASMLEVRALAEATKLLIQARKIRRGEPPATIILNMVRPRYRLAAEMEKAAACCIASTNRVNGLDSTPSLRRRSWARHRRLANGSPRESCGH